MTTPLRLSPVHDALQALTGTWRTVHDMPSLWTLSDQFQSPPVGVMDWSCLTRFGVKGANASEWLAAQGLPVPDCPNTWHPLPDGGIIARLGLTEFLIEDSPTSTLASQLVTACQSPPAKVYPVLRQDLALVLLGDRTHDLLRQTCSFNFQAVALSSRPVILTTMIGVTVTVMPGERNGEPFYRIWCDGTFGSYVWETLVGIATELGGGAIGTELVWGR